jgi:hypothetical protein
MTSAEDALLDWGFARKLNCAGFISRIDDAKGGQYSEAVILADGSSAPGAASQMIEKYFDQNSFSGYILPKGSTRQPLDLLSRNSAPGRHRTIFKIVKEGGVYFEDWDDGCGLKIWTNSMDKKRLVDLLNRLGQRRVRPRLDRRNGHMSTRHRADKSSGSILSKR